MSIQGVIVAVLTPFDKSSKRVDLSLLEWHIRFLLDHGVHGLFICGTVGEGILLAPDERKSVLVKSLEVCRGRIPVIAHVGHLQAAIAEELAEHARQHGADAIASLPPYYFPLDDNSLFDYFCSVAKAAAPVPFYIYNYPAATNNTISPALLRRLAEALPNLKGIKDSSKSAAEFVKLMEAVPTLDGMVGSDSLILDAMQAGGVGVVSTVANVFPGEVVRLYQSYQTGDSIKGEQLQQLVIRLRGVLKTGPYISTYKAALALMGHNAGGVRSPLRDPNEAELSVLKSALDEVEAIRAEVMT